MSLRRVPFAPVIFAVLMNCVFAVVQSQPAVAQETEIPTEIKDVLVENANRLDPVNIFFTLQRKPATGTEEELSAKLHVAPITPFFYLKHGTTRWKGGKFYSQVDTLITLPPSTFEVRINERAFDGKNYYFGYRSVDNAKKNLLTGSMADETRPERIVGFRLATDCFEAFGYQSPRGQEELLDSHLTSAVISPRGNPTVIGVSEEQIDGSTHVRIEVQRDNSATDVYSLGPPDRFNDKMREKIAETPTRRNYVYYLDPKRRYAVRRQEEWYDNQRLLRRRECAKFEFFEDRNIWLPRQCETTFYEWSLIVYPAPLFIDHLKVDAFDLQPSPDEEFVLGKNYE